GDLSGIPWFRYWAEERIECSGASLLRLPVALLSSPPGACGVKLYPYSWGGGSAYRTALCPTAFVSLPHQPSLPQCVCVVPAARYPEPACPSWSVCAAPPGPARSTRPPFGFNWDIVTLNIARPCPPYGCRDVQLRPSGYDWEEEQVSSPNILRLIYQGRFLHGNVTLGALKLPLGKTTVMHLVARETLPEPNSQGQRNREKTGESNCCVIL
uniref:Ubiquitin-like 3 n=1 Tax=Xenopus tropicalis TaxID=8364 RepID=A0A803KBL8_XENTR